MTARASRPLVALVLALAASSVFAQSATPAGDPQPQGAAVAAQAARSVPLVSSSAVPIMRRGYLGINGGYQVTSNVFSTSWSVPYYLESQRLTSSYSNKAGAVIDVGGGVRVWRNLALGAAFSRYRRSDAASLTATVPHPLLFDQPRTFSGTLTGPSRTETAVHVTAMWVIPARRKVQVGVFGGPSFFSVDQVMVRTVTFADNYPYTNVTVASTTTQSVTQSRVGFNAGADLTILFSDHVGVGTLFRYTGASRMSPVPSIPSAPNVSTSLSKAGGLQVGAGLRLRF